MSTKVFVKAEMECHRLKAFHTVLLEVSVWEPFGEKHRNGCVKPDVRVADSITQNERRVFENALN